MIIVFRPCRHIIGNDIRLNHHMLSNLNIIYAFTNRIDHTREFMAHSNRRRLT